MRKFCLNALAITALVFGVTACGGGGGGGTGTTFGGGTPTAVTITGVTATATTLTVGFTVTDANGDALFGEDGNPDTPGFAATATPVTTAGASAAASTVKQDGDAVDLECSSFTVVRPQTGQPVSAATLLDDSGSMGGSDPSLDRATASKLFIDSICATASNLFAVFDFGGSTTTAPFADTQVIYDPADGDYFVDCAAANVTAAKTAIDAAVGAFGGTPMYESMLELCQNMAANTALTNLAMLVLADGQPNSDTNKTAALDCLTNNSITTCTVGLGPASELDPLATTAAVDAMKDIANAGGCVYAAATDATALAPIFQAIGAALSTGQNIVQFLATSLTSGEYTLTLTVGGETATVSFIIP